MKKRVTITYPADPARVAAMLADPAYQRARFERLQLNDMSVDVAARGRGFVATTSGSVPPSRLPSAAARFVRSAVSFGLTESWTEPAADGSRTGSLEATVKGAPVKVGAAMSMGSGADGESTSVVVDLDLSVSVPLVGRSVEEKALARVGRVVADEQRRGAAWLANA
ncbi:MULTISPECIES: DUF2505 domain-containing protein [unclassified Actinomyces]|uniref:DUF2505 domain-containing protein n=1 Tax=unclassified Actinomyces TaxID=2609248 RepID=UPI00137385CC|nr:MULTISPECIES: DUF2505 domain-containing protein [unclassified Actinomyces]MBW3069240.1 DUF2505 domain-containing protein [Actinomyces sp. 594]NDR53065.1 DUF2505 domain-containing protein [Actinomyces sp. 565]QHO90757.1 DUF2505 domain-containing protein [Actinomyces sp. 432]